MGTILASTLIGQASELLQDVNNVQWEVPQLLAWLNDAQRVVALVRPDASVEVISHLLDPGTRQSIAGHRLISVIRNMGSDGLTPGRGIRLVERGLKDDFDPDWHTTASDDVVTEWLFDARVPREFYVYPPVTVSGDVYVELAQAISPANIPNTASAITLEDNYAPALVEWVTYRGLDREGEETPDAIRAATHFKNFFDMLGVKTNIDMAINPKIREHLK